MREGTAGDRPRRAAASSHAREAKDAEGSRGAGSAPAPQCTGGSCGERPRSASPRSGAEASARAVVAPRSARSTRTPRPAPATSPSGRRSPAAEERNDRRHDRHLDGRALGAAGRARRQPAARHPRLRSPGWSSRTSRRCSPDGPAFSAVVRDIADRRRETVDLVAGIEARGFIFGAAVAHGIGFVPVRKAGKRPARPGCLLRPRVRQRHHRDPRGLAVGDERVS